MSDSELSDRVASLKSLMLLMPEELYLVAKNVPLEGKEPTHWSYFTPHVDFYKNRTGNVNHDDMYWVGVKCRDAYTKTERVKEGETIYERNDAWIKQWEGVAHEYKPWH